MFLDIVPICHVITFNCFTIFLFTHKNSYIGTWVFNVAKYLWQFIIRLLQGSQSQMSDSFWWYKTKQKKVKISAFNLFRSFCLKHTPQISVCRKNSKQWGLSRRFMVIWDGVNHIIKKPKFDWISEKTNAIIHFFTVHTNWNKMIIRGSM